MTIDIGAGCGFSNLYLSISGSTPSIQEQWRMHGTFPAGANVATTWSSTSCSGDVNPTHFFIQLQDDSGAAIGTVFPGCGAGAGSMPLVLPRATTFLDWFVGSSLGGPNVQSVAFNGVTASVAPCGQACPYGVQPRAGIPQAVILTRDTIAPWLSSISADWLAPVFVPLYGTAFLIDQVCGGLPPPVPTIDLSTLQATSATALNILKVVSWPSLCQCVPGTPAPTPPSSPILTQPTGWPQAPTFSCDPANVCASLTAIQQTLLQLQSTLGQNLQLETLVQRYSLPFAFVPGATHGPLTGQGSFAVDRLVGLRYTVLSSDPNKPVISDVPPYLWDLGWSSVSDGGAMLQERRIARGHFDWFPPQMAMALSVGYSLKAGTVLTIQELEAEP